MPRDTEVPKAVEPLTSMFLLPLFFTFTGLRMNIALVSGATLWFCCPAIIAVAVSGRLFGCAFTSRARGLPWRESLTVGALVDTRGLIELVVLNIGLERNIISPTLFSMMVLMALVTTLMTTPLLCNGQSRVGIRMIPLERQPTARRARAASYWGPAMTESQYAVFHLDVKTMSMREGEDVPLIFDGLAAAERC